MEEWKMVISKGQSPKTLQLTLYTGVAFIVISMLFLGRQQQSASFAAQAFMVLAVPAFFYVVGGLALRYLRAPLAAPGLIATGAWLVGVGLIHLYEKSGLLPEVIQTYYWFGASLIAGTLISITGHKVRIWMLVPLVPLVQTNLAWATMGALGLDVKWMPALTFLLVLAWWEAPLKDERWTTVYRTSGVLLTLFVLLFNVWLPLASPQSRAITWGAGAILVAILGLRHGWARMGPLSIIILVCASIWGLPSAFWPLAWLGLALVTVIFIERVSLGDKAEADKKDRKAVEISEALAVLLSGASALFAQLSATFGGGMPPIILLLVLLGAGALMIWLGSRRQLLIAMHMGLWLTACAWALFYFIAIPESKMFGLWLALFACGALLVERVLSSNRKEKGKGGNTIIDTVVRWPLADLIIGLSAAIILWTAINIMDAPPHILAITTSIVVGIWLSAGLAYRLPALLHTALWIAPLPYALLLMIAAPWIWTLPLMGMAWQILGVFFLLLGHSLRRYRPAILAPFFIVGFVLIGFGLTLAIRNELFVPVSLGIVMLACIGTSIAVIADYHPAWTVFIDNLLPTQHFPYANRNVKHLFLFLSGWLSAVWLHLMLGHTGMPLPRQGMFMVVFAGLWFILGQMLSKIPGVVGWSVSSAGCLMWLIGLLEVFFAPTEAILTMILGLAISGEMLRRTRVIYWIPVFILQVFFTILQIAWMLSMPGGILLMLVAVGIGIAGMAWESRAPRSGRIIAATGGALALGVWILHPNVYTTLALNVLIVAGVIAYRRWQGLFAIYAGTALLVLQSRIVIDWRIIVILGLAQFVLGAELVKEIRPRRYRSLVDVLMREFDWATPLLWAGLAFTIAGFGMAIMRTKIGSDTLVFAWGSAALLAFYTIRLPLRQFPAVALAGVGASLLITMLVASNQPLGNIGNLVIGLTIVAGAFALATRLWAESAILKARPLTHMRWAVWWIRPLLNLGLFLTALNTALLLVMSNFYHVSPFLQLGSSLLLTAYAIVVYIFHSRLEWLVTAALLAGYSWLVVGGTLHLGGGLWYSLPIGIGLLLAARKLQYGQALVVEGAGVTVLIAGAVMAAFRGSLDFTATLTIGSHLLGLIIYGFAMGRRIPFVAALTITLAGLGWSIARVNLWFIPLGAGVILLGITLLIEAQGELVERWVQGWLTRWNAWK
jgi:hypothetical protein